MKYATEKKTSSFYRQAEGRDQFSVTSLRRLLRTLPVWKGWPAMLSQESLIECLRSIAEVVVWGDQNDPGVFTVFRNEAGLERLVRVLRRKSNRRGPVAAQVLQTFAMLVQNIKDKRSLTFLLNHEVLRTVITTDFDFSNEDVLGYYVSLVKSIAFKLNESNIGSFTRRHSTRQDVYSMPLFAEAAKFINSPERMVRAAARTLTLTIMSLKNDKVDKFLVSDDNRGFYRAIVKDLKNKIDQLKRLNQDSEQSKETIGRVDHLTAEIEDVISYLNDIYTSGSKGIQMELATSIWDNLMGEYLILPLYDALNTQLGVGFGSQATTEDNSLFLQLPKTQKLMSIVTDWLPWTDTDFHRSIVHTLVTSTLNVLLRKSEFLYCRAIMQLINQAFKQLEKSSQQRLVPLVNIDLETFDLSDDGVESKWRIGSNVGDGVRMSDCVSPGMDLLDIAARIGLPVCRDVLKALYEQTNCQMYKPSALLESLAKHPRSLFNTHRFLSLTTHSAKNLIKSASSLKAVHKRLRSLPHGSALHLRKKSTDV